MKRLFVGNWKMWINNKDAIDYFYDNNTALQKLTHTHSIIICPSFTELSSIGSLLKKNNIALGAQDCSAFFPGAYTGQIAAEHLTKLNCTYCIIGHSERRIFCSETNEIIAEKAKRLLENNITPIICIGETSTECIAQTTYQTLEEQLIPIFTALNDCKKKDTTIIIAYEPVWAIGTGIVPSHDYLTAIFSWLHKQAREKLANYTITLLYGGSVDEKTITQLLTIKNINGFLIGKASTNFEKFKLIIESGDTIL